MVTRSPPGVLGPVVARSGPLGYVLCGSRDAFPPSAPGANTARQVGGYEVLAEIGQGAMGKVYQGSTRCWRYEPPTKDGVRVEMRFRQSFRIGR